MTEKVSLITREGIIVEGVITKRNNFQLHVEMTKPYTNWKMKSAFTSLVPAGWRDFVENYKLRARRMLMDGYLKLEKIDMEMDLIEKVYVEYLEEMDWISRIESSKTKDRILYKLDRWFFEIFLAGLTKQTIFSDDRERILKIVTVYHKEKRKIYLDEPPNDKLDYKG